MKLGIIGCGKMGTALVVGVIKAGVVAVDHVIGVDPIASAREAFTGATGARTTEQIADLVGCDVVILSTKPQEIRAVLRELSDLNEERSTLVISIAAGISIGSLEAVASEEIRVIRAMPNTPAMVGCGAAAFCLGSRNIGGDAEIAKRILGQVGLVVEVSEKLMDAVTGLSGSGPAFVYLMIEALADAGVKQGLGRKESLLLAAQTMMGGAKMVLDTGLHPAVLKDMVTSPGGTTIEGLAVLEQMAVRSALIQAVEASAERSAELGS